MKMFRKRKNAFEELVNEQLLPINVFFEEKQIGKYYLRRSDLDNEAEIDRISKSIEIRSGFWFYHNHIFLPTISGI